MYVKAWCYMPLSVLYSPRQQSQGKMGNMETSIMAPKNLEQSTPPAVTVVKIRVLPDGRISRTEADLGAQKFLIFMSSLALSTFPFVASAFGVISKKSLPN